MTTATCSNRRSLPIAQTPPVRPLRVCFMIDDLAVAGIEGQLLLLLTRLDRFKIEPYLCLLNGMNERLHSLEPDDCPVTRLGICRLLRPSSGLKALRFARYLRRQRIDVLHPLFPDSLYFGALAAKIAQVPCVAGFRVDLGYWMRRRDRWFGKLIHRFVGGSVANCEACRQSLVADQGVVPESVTIIPNGVDLTRFNAAKRRDRGETGAEQRVGIVANLRPVKNLELFIRAAAALAPTHPRTRFEIAGEGTLRGELQSLIDALSLSDRVTLLGTVTDVPAFLNRLDVAVLCSHSEGSPNAIMEYMAAGLPSVVTDVGGNRELIEHDCYGLVVPSNDCDRLSTAIARLLDDRQLAAHMGAGARQRAFAEFSVETQARRYEDFYFELVSKGRYRN
jgi:L-malate glycosyltransferase